MSGALPGDNTEQRARVYLERTVQIKFDMPPLDELSAYRLFTSVLEATLSRHGIAMQDADRDRLLFFYRNSWRPQGWHRFGGSARTSSPILFS